MINEKLIKDINNYSTEEQIIGEYMGKPLYRRTYNTYTLESETVGTLAIYVFDTNSDIRIKKEEFNALIVYSNTHFYDVNFNNFDNIYFGKFSRTHNIDDGKIQIIRENYKENYSIVSMELTLEYTKTTD